MNSEKTIPELIANRIRKHNSKILFQRRDGWSWKQITWLDFEREVKSISSFLMDLGFGFGDTALVISSNRMESISTEIAIHLIGGVTIPIAEHETLENVVGIAKEFKTKFIFLGIESILGRIQDIYQELPTLERVVIFSDVTIRKDYKVIPFKGVLKLGFLKRKLLEDELVKTSKSVLPKSLATIFYSSNSHAKTERKEVTQGDLMGVLHSVSGRLSFIDEEDQSFSYLPSVSPFEKLINHFGIYMGTRIVMAENREDFFEDIVEVKPTVLFETKIGLENICSKISSKAGSAFSSEKLKSELGSRIKYVVMDSLPGEEIKNLFSKSRVSLIEIPEVNNLVTRSNY
jgi:long-subunit acyl-CoA synthetase (AMP-forming)